VMMSLVFPFYFNGYEFNVEMLVPQSHHSPILA